MRANHRLSWSAISSALLGGTYARKQPGTVHRRPGWGLVVTVTLWGAFVTLLLPPSVSAGPMVCSKPSAEQRRALRQVSESREDDAGCSWSPRLVCGHASDEAWTSAQSRIESVEMVCHRVRCRQGANDKRRKVAGLVCVPSAAGSLAPGGSAACADVGAECGLVTSACGATVDCGECTLPATCGGGGVANVCGVPEGGTCPDGTQPPCEDAGGCPGFFDARGAPGPRPQFPPSLQIAGNCASEGMSSNYVVAEQLASTVAEELHVIGVYEGLGDPGLRDQRRGVVHVIVHPRPKPIVLFLSAYESIRWRIELDPGAHLSRVIAQGYEPQLVEGVPKGVDVNILGPEQICGLAYGWEISNGGNESMIAHVRQLTGLTETSFQGCYSGQTFEVPYWTSEPPTALPPHVPGDETIARRDVDFPGCGRVLGESTYCLTTSDGGIGVLGLDSGTVCPVTPTTAPLWGPETHSIAWRGEILYACGEAGLIRISLRTGEWEAAQLPCEAVAAHGSNILVMLPIWADLLPDGDNLYEYPSYEALLGGRHGASFNVGFGSESMTVRGDTFYGAWHSTDSINLVDLPSEAPLGVLTLEGYDDWILGMAVTSDDQFVVAGPDWGEVVVIFDAKTGHQIRKLRPTQAVAGLSCVTR